MRGDDAAASADERTQLIALRVAQHGNIRQDQRLVIFQMLGVQQAVMDHLERNTRLNQRLIPAQRIVLDLRAVVPGRLLRIDQPHARKRTTVGEVVLVLLGPHINLFDLAQPSLIMQCA